ncbi:Cytochrome c oxidase subunit CcoN [Helicobacter bizzozeronii CCUG 35545]|nr:Cytochrome c oxidase subunit CcoN [Helicobacter bizzozeronii CCUG 35545]
MHDGVLGWVGFTLIAAVYHMVPRVFKRELYSAKLMDIQFWLMTLGIVLYFSSMWISGITQGMMWRDTDQYGNLVYQFVDTVRALFPFYIIRGIGGSLYLIGFFIFLYNVIMTIQKRASA